MRSVDKVVVYRDLLATIDAGPFDPMCDGSVLLLGICFGGRFVMQATWERTMTGSPSGMGRLGPGCVLSALSQCRCHWITGG